VTPAAERDRQTQVTLPQATQAARHNRSVALLTRARELRNVLFHVVACPEGLSKTARVGGSRCNTARYDAKSIAADFIRQWRKASRAPPPAPRFASHKAARRALASRPIACRRKRRERMEQSRATTAKTASAWDAAHRDSVMVVEQERVFRSKGSASFGGARQMRPAIASVSATKQKLLAPSRAAIEPGPTDGGADSTYQHHSRGNRQHWIAHVTERGRGRIYLLLVTGESAHPGYDDRSVIELPLQRPGTR